MCVAVERCVAVGVFDGVHIGHRAILQGVDTAITFSRHPLCVVNSIAAPKLIVSLEQRIDQIRKCGVRNVEVLDFSEEMASLSAARFAEKYFASVSGRIKVRCGENWRFGCGGEGSAQWLRDRGVKVEEVPYALHQGAVVSSSRIRRALADGEISDVNAMLGRNFSLSGRCVPGKGHGRKLGFPTLNLQVDSLLRRGVYEVEVTGRKAIANYGLAPTMGAQSWSAPVLEVHLIGCGCLDCDPAEEMEVEFLRFIRPERMFASLEELRAQISADVASVSERG